MLGAAIFILYTKYMIFLFVSIVVPLLVFISAPWIVRYFKGNPAGYEWLLFLACSFFFVSWYLPSPLIDGNDTSFTTHFVGGGLFTGLLWLYFKYSLRLRGPWWIEGFTLFALVSALGCVNELFELSIVQTGIHHMTLDDTSWDILANSLGALTIYIGYLLYDSWHR